MFRSIKKLICLLCVVAITATIGVGVFSYFVDYESQSVIGRAGTLAIKLTESIDLDGENDIVVQGYVSDVDFNVKNIAEKSADVKAVVTVTGIPKAGVTPTAPSPYKLIINDSSNDEDGSYVEVGNVEKIGNAYKYTLPVYSLIGSIEKDSVIDASTVDNVDYIYDLFMDDEGLSEWQASSVDVIIEIFAKQHRNTDVLDDSWVSIVEKGNGTEYTYNVVYQSASGVQLGTSTASGSYGTIKTINPKDFNGYLTPNAKDVAWDSTESKTITFVYSPIKYIINYVLNGGIQGSGEVTNYDVETDTFNLPVPTKENYTFLGWYTTPNFSDNAVSQVTKGSYGNKDFYARWTPTSYSINYVLNGGTQGSGVKTSYTAETDTFNLPIPTREGYTFGGWYTTENFSDSAVVQIGKGSTGSKTFYAKWSPVSYSITYNLNSGTQGANAVAGYNIETETFNLPTPTRTGYTFEGWYESSNFSTSKVTSIAKGSTGNKTFYAKWKDTVAPTLTVVSPTGETSDNPTCFETINYVVSGNVTDGTGVQSLTVNGNSVFVNPDGSWSTNVTFEINKVTAVTVVATDTQGNTTTITRYALCQKPIAVTYNAKGGSFANGSTNVVEYKLGKKEIVKTSKTSNVGDDGSWSSGYLYPVVPNGINDIVTIPGAESLEVTITAQTYNWREDWVAVYDGSVTPTTSNYDKSISDQRGGPSKLTFTYTIQGDTAQFFWRSSPYCTSAERNYYGYYATVKGVGDGATVVSGNLVEPTHTNSDLVFDGWYTDEACTPGNEFDPNTDVAALTGDITVYAKWRDATPTVSYNANGGSFANGNIINNVGYKLNQEEITKISKTSNVNTDGSQNGNYASDLAVNDVVTIPGAESLEVTVTYGTESHYSDWVAVYDGSMTPSSSNYMDSISGQLGDGNNSTTTSTFIIPGDTVQFFFVSDSSGNYYGYYATVKGVGKTATVVSGNLVEPTHSDNGFVFEGWYTDAACTPGNEFDPNTDVFAFAKDITVYAKWRDTTPTVSYNANGGSFANGNIINNVEYTVAHTPTTKTSKTSNVSEDGSYFSGAYPYDKYGINDIVTIPGAESLEVAITYQTRNSYYDYVSIFDGSITPSTSTIDSSITGKLGGTTKTSKTYTIEGDTAQFFFRATQSSRNYYGYYATVKGVGKTVTVISGEYLESVHSDADKTFLGWYTDEACTPGNEFDPNTDVPSLTNNTTVYAKWSDTSTASLLVNMPMDILG